MKTRFYYILVWVIGVFVACTPLPKDVSKLSVLPPMYPDYTDITVPYNIAPLNFLLRNDADAVECLAQCGESVLQLNKRGHEIYFPIAAWKKFMNEAKGKTAEVKVSARINGRWVQYRTFRWQIASDKIDPYLSYRLIEPDYEVWNHLQLVERCVEGFEEHVICDHNLVDNSCMNCHIYGNQDPKLSLFYVRGKNGGTILNRNGKLRKLNIKNSQTISSGVYAGFHPSGRYGVFSSNIIIPAFHAVDSKRLEVYDTKSDIFVADFDRNTIYSCPQLSDSTVLETFPTFSSDGRYIYFCTARRVDLPKEIKRLKYSLCRISFNAANHTFGTKVDTIYNARLMGHSVCHPKVSPDGKWLVYTVADYGTFPIWHREADLQMINLRTETIDKLAVVNSNRSDTYHSWSSNSRWLVFASKRDDGLYGKPYFCYIDRAGKAHKPFVLPQKYPAFYDDNLKSFNIPELSKGKLSFNAVDIERLMKKENEKFK
jgi:Periplasmic component of the Tol biopolymer transport system